MFDLSDDTIIKLAASGTAAYAAHFVAAPRHAQDLYFTTTTPSNPASNRWFGFGLGCAAAEAFVATGPTTKETKKTMLKTLGALWLASSAVHLLHVQEGTQRRELATWQAVGHGALGALCLWRGFQD